ncbi:zinc finger protein 491-like isoform X2 [Cheilinus undulatus]|uniref:zinc finger protein 491-like isoform X2 n=1 Tax=Cheilinus undulatus TaxID=241271 RepID=UPI001BD644A8|nr:zinc finger protein 491-like isoform X2 [Cheilinus undulatus]
MLSGGELFMCAQSKMEAANMMFVSPVELKLSKTDILREVVTEKLTTAAREIFAVVERTVAGYEEEAAGLRQEIDRQRIQLEAVLQPRVSLSRIEEDLGSRNMADHADEDEEAGEEEFSEEPLEDSRQQDPRDADYQPTNARPLLMKRRMKRAVITLRVCLLKDSRINLLKRGVLKSQLKTLSCPWGMQEVDFLDLLRATFPQLTGEFDAFTVDATRRLRPLKVRRLTPEEIKKSLKSTGKGRSALYIRVKAANKTLSSPEKLPLPKIEDNIIDQTSNNGTRPQEWSHDSPAEAAESSRSNLSEKLVQQQETEGEENREQYGISEDFGVISSACSLAERDDENENEVEEDDGDEESKPEKTDEKPKLALTHKIKRTQVKRSIARKRIKSINVRESTDKSGVPLPCKVCKTLTGSKNILIKHSWSHVEDPERLCGVCGEQSESVEELKTHLESHRKTYSCDICGKNLLTFLSLRRHAILHTGEKPYQCDVCSKTFASASALRNHRWEHVEDKPHKCEVCGRTFAFKPQLRIHSRIHTGEKPYICDLCGKDVTNFRSLSRHKLIHFGKKRHSCQVCGKRFLTLTNMKQHQKIHTSRDKTCLCEICCKMFHTKGQLNAHLATHREEKLTCNICGKSLSSKGALTRHLIIHSGERPYKCTECGQAFNAITNLRNHQKIHSGARPYVCGVCGKACSRKDHLRIHMRIHNGEKPYKCTVCYRGFTQSHCLKTHMKSHKEAEKSAEEEPMD